MGGSGGDDGYEAKQAAQEAKKQAARDALNLQFGVAPISAAVAPSRDAFTTNTPASTINVGSSREGSGYDLFTPASSAFDQAGYDQALSSFNTGSGVADSNKAARETLYQGVRDNAYTAGKRRLDEQRDNAAKALKFELFAKGLNGGSEDINQNAKLGRTYTGGLVDLGGKADAAAADFRGNDESARLGLLQSIDSGVDQGSAISSALTQQSVNAQKAASEATGTTLGDLFATGGELYNQSQARLGKQAGADWWNTYGTGNKKAANTTGNVSSGSVYG